jgi:hypothetical protein
MDDQYRSPTNPLVASLARRQSRRTLLAVAAAGAAAALGSAGLLQPPAAHAAGMANDAFLREVFNILATGERLSVTFYQGAVANNERLGFDSAQLLSLKAILVEEQIHVNAADAQGGMPATTHFSFPLGAATFTDRAAFLTTMKLLEEQTSAALLALIKDCARRGLAQHARLAGQLLAVEGGHRVVGRMLGGTQPVADWAFAPATIKHILDVPAVAAREGFLNPTPGNDHAYQPVSASLPGVTFTTPVTA